MALSFLRRNKGVLVIRLLLGLVILSMVIYFVPFFWDANAGTRGEEVGRVAGQPITAGEFQRTYMQQREQYRRLYGDRLDPAMLRALGLHDQVFDALVDR